MPATCPLLGAAGLTACRPCGVPPDGTRDPDEGEGMRQEQVEKLEGLQSKLMVSASTEASTSTEVRALEPAGPGAWPERGDPETHGLRLADALDALRETRDEYRSALYAVQQAAIARGEEVRDEMLREIATITEAEGAPATTRETGDQRELLRDIKIRLDADADDEFDRTDTVSGETDALRKRVHDAMRATDE